ncbi:MAG: RNA polymerase factor sigma-54 [Verrucomicrobiota bacterium]|nr:RNA polymerase factor sigma-54 [Verrucomicrobiota bacterium]
MSAQSFQQVQKLAQSQVLAPQLRQSLKILQSATLELRNVILEELQANPVLEELPMEGVAIEPTEANTEPDPSDNRTDPSSELRFGENFEVFNKLDQEWRDSYAEESSNTSYGRDDDEKRKHFFDSLTSETSLQEHLMRQAELLDIGPGQKKALEFLIGSLDDNGFITTPLKDISLMAELPLSEVQDAAAILKTLEPYGIGASNLQECLLIQLKQAGKQTSMAAAIVRQHYDLLLKRRIPDIARKLDVAAEDVEEAIDVISTLDPAPGRKFSEDNNRVIVADVTIDRGEDGEFHISLNSDYIPRLRLSNTYKDLITRGNLTQKEKEYLQEKFRSGKFLISSIEQRQQTIERITKEILLMQHDFFEEGPSKLRPLTMNTVANAVGVHETTVSRAIANKYVQTPHGLFEFKYFFTPGYQSADGEALSNTIVKEAIARIIGSENPVEPMSDQEVVGILSRDGIKIARRTVAKYREELGILPTHMRRRYA